MIRCIQPGEENEVRRLLAELSNEDQFFWAAQAMPFQKHFEKYRKMPVCEKIEGKNTIFVVEEDAKVVGLCWCTLVDRGIDRQGEIAEFYVEREYRGKRIGEELIEAAKKFFMTEKAEVVFVWTHRGNEAAKKLYESAGFKEVTQIVMAFVPT